MTTVVINLWICWFGPAYSSKAKTWIEPAKNSSIYMVQVYFSGVKTLKFRRFNPISCHWLDPQPPNQLMSTLGCWIGVYQSSIILWLLGGYLHNIPLLNHGKSESGVDINRRSFSRTPTWGTWVPTTTVVTSPGFSGVNPWNGSEDSSLKFMLHLFLRVSPERPNGWWYGG